MKTKITVYAEQDDLEISTLGDDYKISKGQYSSIIVSSDELQELAKMIEEIIQLKNKRDW